MLKPAAGPNCNSFKSSQGFFQKIVMPSSSLSPQGIHCCYRRRVARSLASLPRPPALIRSTRRSPPSPSLSPSRSSPKFRIEPNPTSCSDHRGGVAIAIELVPFGASPERADTVLSSTVSSSSSSPAESSRGRRSRRNHPQLPPPRPPLVGVESRRLHPSPPVLTTPPSYW